MTTGTGFTLAELTVEGIRFSLLVGDEPGGKALAVALWHRPTVGRTMFATAWSAPLAARDKQRGVARRMALKWLAGGA